ncbi:thioredoxin family protein [bacterium]|nr:thioredoxin family protein [bacterium]
MKRLMFLMFLIPVIACAQDGYKVGDAVKDFKLKNVDSKFVSLKDMKDAKGVIVVFTCNTCPYAQAYEQRVIDLHNKFASAGYPVIAINPNDPNVQPGDSFDKMVERARDKKYPFAYVMDETQEIAKAFGATRTPHVYLLQNKGDKFEVAYIGAIDDNTEDGSLAKNKYVELAVDALSKGQKPATNFTKAIGCTIKWKKNS